ncbi:MAG: DsbA family oxidoreductase [Azospirillaceae bacterium]|nr:DsbA family oxidoreductase [Azospirillaceae bacterium]
MAIEIFADLICPWCYIGRHRIRRALAERPRLPADFRWSAFELNPDVPVGGMDHTTYLAARFGGLARARQIQEAISEIARRDGLAIRLDLIKRIPNTLMAHRLVQFAQKRGAAVAMIDALFDAFFVQGLDIGDAAVLGAIGRAGGFGEDQVKAFLMSDAGIAEVRNSESRARQLGIQAVPCFIFNRCYVLAGAQEPQTFLPLLDIVQEDIVAVS